MSPDTAAHSLGCKPVALSLLVVAEQPVTEPNGPLMRSEAPCIGDHNRSGFI